MKVLRRIGISVLLILSLAVGLCFGQNTPEQIHTKGLEYAAEGKFEEAMNRTMTGVAEYRNIEGLEYSFETWATAFEAYEAIGKTPPG